MKKYLAVAVILLFIGLAVAPSINANVNKDSLVEFREKLMPNIDEFQQIRKSIGTINLNDNIRDILIMMLQILSLPFFIVLVFVSSIFMVLAYKLEDLGLTTLSEVFTFIYGFSTIIAILLFFWYISENQ